MRLFEIRLSACAAIAALAVPVAAQAQEIKPLFEPRLRLENVDQDGFSRQADAVTVRLRAGAEMTGENWSALFEGEATAAPVERAY